MRGAGLSVWTCLELDRQPATALPTSPPASAKACEAPHSDDDWVHYVIVRKDLTVGQIVAQTIHATGESTPGRVPKNTVAVALGVRDQAHLLERAARLERAGIPHVLITECDGEPMAIGIEPTKDRAKIRKETSDLALIK